MSGSASGVCSPALWNSTMEPFCTFVVTRFVMSAAEMPFQSRLSLSHTAQSPALVFCVLGYFTRGPQHTYVLVADDIVTRSNKRRGKRPFSGPLPLRPL